MIKANELRVGNWVEGPMNAPVQIRDGKQIDEYANYYAGIPLTPELLEKCGFYKQEGFDRNGFSMYYGIRMALYVDETESPLYNITIEWEEHILLLRHLGRFPDMKLHQLQNLYFALIGKELEITL